MAKNMLNRVRVSSWEDLQDLLAEQSKRAKIKAVQNVGEIHDKNGDIRWARKNRVDDSSITSLPESAHWLLDESYRSRYKYLIEGAQADGRMDDVR